MCHILVVKDLELRLSRMRAGLPSDRSIAHLQHRQASHYSQMQSHIRPIGLITKHLCRISARHCRCPRTRTFGGTQKCGHA